MYTLNRESLLSAPPIIICLAMSKIRFQRSQADQPGLTDLYRFQLPGAQQPPQILDIVVSRLICWLKGGVILNELMVWK